MINGTSLSDAMRIDCAWTADRISECLKEKLAETGKHGFCLGLSGGVDSAVTAALAVKAVGDAALVHGLYLPDRDSDQSCGRRASRLARELNIHFQMVDFSDRAKAEGVYNSPVIRLLRISPRLNRVLFRLYHGLRRLSGESRVLENSRPKRVGNISGGIKNFFAVSRIMEGFVARHVIRRRMLEEYAEENNLLLIGAANRSELFIGWFAKDGVDDLPVAPILGLYKNQVFQMARFLGVPQEIIEASPTPDMLKGLNDLDLVGFGWEKIDKVAYVVEHDLPETIAFLDGISPSEFEEFLWRHRCTVEKRKNQHAVPVLD